MKLFTVVLADSRFDRIDATNHGRTVLFDVTEERLATLQELGKVYSFKEESRESRRRWDDNKKCWIVS